MIVDISQIDPRNRYKLMIGAILPRPIAWVSTKNEDDTLNLAPFSYFTAVCTTPMTLLFCPGYYPDGRKKDTWVNIERLPEFVINITNEATKEPMNLTATTLPPGQSEFEWAGVTPAASEKISVPRVAEAPISFECKLQQIIAVGNHKGGGAAILGEVHCVHVQDELYENGRILHDKLQPIGRLAGNFYTHTHDTFEIRRIPPPK